jgi:hypothetical protein
MLTTTPTMGSPTPLMPTTPSKQQICRTCMTKNFYDAHSTTNITALLTISGHTYGLCPISKPGCGQQLPYILTTSPDDQIPQGLQANY